jgi:hypothetical protein
MSRRENAPNFNLCTPPSRPPANDDGEWWGWFLLDLLADLPEMLIRYVFGRLCSRRPNSDERGRKRERV